MGRHSMGRHSASYIAAQRGQSTGPSAAGTARYVGGVGVAALSLWAGAAIAASGIANADDSPTDKGPDVAGAVKSALHSLTGGLQHALPNAATGGTSGVNLPRPGLFKLPTLSDGVGSLTNPLTGLVGSTQASTTERNTAPKSNPLRVIQPNANLSQAAPVVTSVVDAVRGGAPSVGASPFSVAPAAKATPAASVTSVAPAVTAPASAAPASTASFLTAVGTNPLSNTGGTPTVPAASNLLGALQLMRRDNEQPSLAQPASLTSIGSILNPKPAQSPTTLPHYPNGMTSPTGTPPAANQTTPVSGVGDVGKWMLKSDGSLANYGGQTYGGKTLVEPVNVIIVDPTSKTPAEASAKLNKAMFLSGFPPQPIHTGGFMGLIGTKNYGQKPGIPLTAYSDNLFILDNDHGRIFGPAPLAGANGGYVWTGAFSSETLGISENGIPGHTYVSSNAARDALALRMLASGQVQSIDYVPLNNAVPANDPNYTSGDHDGYAVVITLK